MQKKHRNPIYSSLIIVFSMANPGKSRTSGIPAPGKSGIPGRSCSASNSQSAQPIDAESMSRALSDAIKASHPAQHRLPQIGSRPSSPHSVKSGRHSAAEGHNGNQLPGRTKTPAVSQSTSRSPSRQSDVQPRNVNRQLNVGDSVRVDSLALEGVLRYMGEIEGKNGVWAGVELISQFAGRGKNNGSVNG